MSIQSARILSTGIFLVAVFAGMYGCKKYSVAVPPAHAHFLGQATGNYQINAPGVTYKIPVGVTNVAQVDRTINVSISSPTGAQEGTHYTVDGSLIIPAGKAVDTLVVSGMYDEYLSGREDVLEITLNGGEVEAATFSNKVTINVSGPCFEDNIVLSEMEGEYLQTFDGSYGPYTTTVKSLVSSGPTSAIVTISNIFDWGWSDLEFTIDWSDPANPAISFVPQATGFDAGGLNPAAAGHEAWITPPATGSMGTYSYCNQTFTINYSICMPTLGGACFNEPYSTVMAR